MSDFKMPLQAPLLIGLVARRWIALFAAFNDNTGAGLLPWTSVIDA